jgi:hypothetical protein
MKFQPFSTLGHILLNCSGILFSTAAVQEVPPGGSAKIKVKARLNLHGLVSLESATQVFEEEVEEAQAPDAAAAKEKDGDTPMRVGHRALQRSRPPPSIQCLGGSSERHALADLSKAKSLCAVRAHLTLDAITITCCASLC